MKLEDMIANLKDAPTTTVATIGLIVTAVGYFKDAIAAATKALADMGYTMTPDKETWLYVAVGLVFVKMMFFEGGKKPKPKAE